MKSRNEKKKMCVMAECLMEEAKGLIDINIGTFFYESVRGKKVTFAGVTFKIKALIGFFFSWNLHFIKFTHSFRF